MFSSLVNLQVRERGNDVRRGGQRAVGTKNAAHFLNMLLNACSSVASSATSSASSLALRRVNNNNNNNL